MKKLIQNIVGHYRSHQDEMLAIWLLRMRGERTFPGVSKAKVMFLEKELEAQKTYADDIYVGVGGSLRCVRGIVIDEHRENGRLENTCAALIAAQELGIDKHPKYEALLADALWCDTKNEGIREARLANLIKAMHRVKKARDQFGTYRFAAAAFNAIVDGAKDHGFDLRAEFAQFVRDRNLPLDLASKDKDLSKESRAMKNVHRFVQESFGRRNDHVTELAYIACRMDRSIVHGWLADAFQTMVDDAMDFQWTLQALRENNNVIDIDIGGCLEPACLIESDSELVNKAVNNGAGGKPAILVVRRSSGHVQVFGDAARNVELYDVGAMIRMAEYKARTGKVFTFESARGEGTMKLCKVWHQPNPNTLLNGSLTHPGIEPSVLSLKDLEDIVSHAFTESGRQAWIERYTNNSNPGESLFIGESLEDLLSAQLQLAS